MKKFRPISIVFEKSSPRRNLDHRSLNLPSWTEWNSLGLPLALGEAVSSYTATLPPAQKSTWQGERRDGGCGPTLVSSRFVFSRPLRGWETRLSDLNVKSRGPSLSQARKLNAGTERKRKSPLNNELTSRLAGEFFGEPMTPTPVGSPNLANRRICIESVP